MNNSPFKILIRVLPVLAILALSGCSDLDAFGLFGDDTPTVQTSADEGLRKRSNTEQASAEGSDTPSLTSVPSRPVAGSTAVRDRVVEGLISDRDNARYTDEVIRLQGVTRPVADTTQAASVPLPLVTPAPPAPITRSAVPTPAPITRSAVPTPAPITRSAVPTPAPASSQSVVVDMNALGGNGYSPVSAQISREYQVATIQFGYSSSRLGARDQQVIATVVSAYRQNEGGILVVGHASSRTKQLPEPSHKVANFKVSFARANAVARALVRAGVAPERVTVEAVADHQPVYSEAMPSGEAGNRRAEIFFLQ
jgi:outer membrane protein OmpA-like peptidoglycan-associated protein